MSDDPETVRPASLFHRDRTPTPVIEGLERLEGIPAFEMPISCRLLAIDFESQLASLEQVATLRMRIAPVAQSYLRCEMYFRNVREIRLPRLMPEGVPCRQLVIEDAGQLGWTGVHWQVYDQDADSLAFYAEHAEIVSVYREG